MKKTILKKILLVCMLANLVNGFAYAGIGEWVARKKQQSREYMVRKIGEAEQKTQELLTYLRANTRCLVQGDCPPAKRKKLRAIAAAITAMIIAIIAATVSYRRGETEERISITAGGDAGAPKAASITDFLPGYVPDDSEQGMFMKGVHMGLLDTVKTYADLVQERVLDAGSKLAKHMQAMYPIQENYQAVSNYLEGAQSTFNAAVQRANDYLLSAVRQESEELVKDSYCATPAPSRNAVQVGLEILTDRGKKYVEKVYKERIVPIINFLRKPQCAR